MVQCPCFFLRTVLRPVSVDNQSEELSLELHVSVKSTLCSGLVCLHVFVQLHVVTETSYIVYGDYIILWLFKRAPFHPGRGQPPFGVGGRRGAE